MIPNMSPFADRYKSAMERIVKPALATRFSPRFFGLDKLLGGLRPREFSILCGSTGTGKTTLLANLSASLLETQTPHFVASVETGPDDFLIRVMSAIAAVDFNTGDPVPLEQVQNFHLQFGDLIKTNQSQLSLYENRFSVATLIQDITHAHDAFGCKVAMIDNLNFFLDVTSAKESIVEMDRVIHELIIFCKNIDVHIIMVMHPKKTDHGRVESEFDIKGSSTAVQEAHNVWLFNRPNNDLVSLGHATPIDRELKIAKMRRKGKNVGARMILKNIENVKYEEGVIL